MKTKASKYFTTERFPSSGKNFVDTTRIPKYFAVISLVRRLYEENGVDRELK